MKEGKDSDFDQSESKKNLTADQLLQVRFFCVRPIRPAPAQGVIRTVGFGDDSPATRTVWARGPAAAAPAAAAGSLSAGAAQPEAQCRWRPGRGLPVARNATPRRICPRAGPTRTRGPGGPRVSLRDTGPAGASPLPVSARTARKAADGPGPRAAPREQSQWMRDSDTDSDSLTRSGVSPVTVYEQYGSPLRVVVGY
jgi:hypothetical protein